jgi:hypothetical protein
VTGVTGLSDTRADVAQLQIQQLRLMPTWRKLALVAELNQTVRDLAMAGLRRRYPDDSPILHQRRLADLLLGTELAAQAYGTLPKVDNAG